MPIPVLIQADLENQIAVEQSTPKLISPSNKKTYKNQKLWITLQ